jgi:4-azaleucine resistance transporter AzlC
VSDEKKEQYFISPPSGINLFMSNRLASLRTSLIQGMQDTFPLIVAAIPFGIVYGALGTAQGISAWTLMAISLVVFAGASQFIAITLLAAGANLSIIVLTVFIVNLRHMLYSISLLNIVRNISPWKRIPMAFSLTDETYATVIHRLNTDPIDNVGAYYLGSAFFMYTNWQLCSFIGIIAGNHVPGLAELGLDVAMVVAFVGIVVANLRLPSHWICAFTAAISALLTYDWPNQTGLLFSTFIAIAAGMLAEYSLSAKDTSPSAQGESHE